MSKKIIFIALLLTACSPTSSNSTQSSDSTTANNSNVEPSNTDTSISTSVEEPSSETSKPEVQKLTIDLKLTTFSERTNLLNGNTNKTKLIDEYLNKDISLIKDITATGTGIAVNDDDFYLKTNDEVLVTLDFSDLYVVKSFTLTSKAFYNTYSYGDTTGETKDDVNLSLQGVEYEYEAVNVFQDNKVENENLTSVTFGGVNRGSDGKARIIISQFVVEYVVK